MVNPVHVVHVEDDKPLSKILNTTLHAAEPTVNLHQFVRAEDAIRYVQENDDLVDLFVLDIRLPGDIDGLQLAERLRAMGCTAQIIVTSAFNSPATSWLQAVHAEYLAKPWHVLDLTEKLAECRSKRLPKSNTRGWSEDDPNNETRPGQGKSGVQ